MIDELDFEQSSVESPESLLCKELLGKDYEENPADVLRTMMSDRKSVSEQYGIPLIESSESPNEYCKKLVGIAEEKGVVTVYVDQKSLNKANVAAGYTSSGKLVLPKINFDTVTPVEARNWSIKMAHELIHAVQDKVNPSMPIERAEYEAYVMTYLPTAFALAYNECQGVHNYLMYFRIVDNVLGLIKDSSLGNYKKRGVPENSISWNKST